MAPWSSPVARFLLTMICGFAGGVLFWLVGLPLPFLSGSMVAVTIVAVAGLRPRVPMRLRDVAFVLLGISMGAGVTPEALERIAAWPLSIIALAAFVAVVMVAVIAYLRRIAHWDAASAFFAAAPGALVYVMALAMQSDADTRRVALAQSLRLFILVALLPSLIVFVGEGTGAPIPAPAAGRLGGGLAEIGITLAVGVAGALACHAMRVPGGLLVGGMIASAVLHGTGLVGAVLPDWILLPGFVLLGSVIGARFAGTDLALIRETFGHALGAFAVAVVVAALFSGLVAWGLSIPFGQVLLAFAPGGVEAMTIMAFALNLDPAYVGAHHVARFVGLAMFLPFWARPYLKT